MYCILGDGWAIDNIKVFKYFPIDWHLSNGFYDNLQIANSFIQKAQCCFDTEWCETRFTADKMEECKTDIPFYQGKRYVIRGVEIFVCVAALLNVMKFIYVSVQGFLMQKRLPFQDEAEDIARADRLFRLLPLRCTLMKEFSF